MVSKLCFKDFYEAYKLGDVDTHISTIDIAGVTIAALQGAYEKIKMLDKQLEIEKEKNLKIEEKINSFQNSYLELKQKNKKEIEDLQGNYQELKQKNEKLLDETIKLKEQTSKLKQLEDYVEAMEKRLLKLEKLC